MLQKEVIARRISDLDGQPISLSRGASCFERTSGISLGRWDQGHDSWEIQGMELRVAA